MVYACLYLSAGAVCDGVILGVAVCSVSCAADAITWCGRVTDDLIRMCNHVCVYCTPCLDQFSNLMRLNVSTQERWGGGEQQMDGFHFYLNLAPSLLHEQNRTPGVCYQSSTEDFNHGQ